MWRFHHYVLGLGFMPLKEGSSKNSLYRFNSSQLNPRTLYEPKNGRVGKRRQINLMMTELVKNEYN